jgi:hypothetical protein
MRNPSPFPGLIFIIGFVACLGLAYADDGAGRQRDRGRERKDCGSGLAQADRRRAFRRRLTGVLDHPTVLHDEHEILVRIG